MNHLGTKQLKTKHLILRQFKESDAEAIFENWANDPDVTHYMTWTPHGNVENTRALLREWVANYQSESCYNWAIEYSGELIGNISILDVNDHSERGVIGYCLAKKYWGQGIMTEALREVLRFAFEEVGFYRIEGCHVAENVGSGMVMGKCGLIYEGTKRKSFKLFSTGEHEDIIERAILREDYFS